MQQALIDKIEEQLKGSFQKIHLVAPDVQPKIWNEMNQYLWYLEKTHPDNFTIITQEACAFLDHGKSSCEKFLQTVTGYTVKNNQFEVKTAKKTYLFPLVSFQNVFAYVNVSNYPHIQIMFVLKPENYFIISLCYSIEKGMVCVP